MKRLTLGAIIIWLMVSLLVGCGSTEKGPSWKKYINNDLGVSFQYPATWKVITDTEGKVIPEPEILIIDPNTVESDFAANINFIIQQSLLLAPSAAEQAESTEEFFELLGQSSGIKDFQSLGFEPVKIGLSEAGILTMEYTVSQNNLRVRAKQLMVPAGQRTFFITCTALVETWDNYEQVFDQVLKSFQFE